MQERWDRLESLSLEADIIPVEQPFRLSLLSLWKRRRAIGQAMKIIFSPACYELALRRVDLCSGPTPTFTGPRDTPGGLSIREDRRP